MWNMITKTWKLYMVVVEQFVTSEYGGFYILVVLERFMS